VVLASCGHTFDSIFFFVLKKNRQFFLLNEQKKITAFPLKSKNTKVISFF